MIAQKYSKFAIVALSLGIVLAALPTKSFAAKKTKSSKASTTTTTVTKTVQGGSDESAIRGQIDALSRALADGDAKRLAALWTEDGRFTDEDGADFKGRHALEKRFEAVFTQNGKLLVDFHPDETRMLDSNVALSTGTVSRKDRRSNQAPNTRYSMVFLKQNGAWLISSATETPLVASSSYDNLQDLAWLIGDWAAQGEKGSVKMKAEWAANKNFISCLYEMQKFGDNETVESRQVIGWDPRTAQPISWRFDSNGGFGYGNWTKNDKQWVIDAAGVEHDGTTSAATDIISQNDPNSFSWQSLHRTINGAPFGDTTVVKIQRVSK